MSLDDRSARIAASVPVDRVAARVVRPGVHWAPAMKENVNSRRWRDPPNHLIAKKPDIFNFVDLTGRRFGRFTVYAYLGKLNPKKKAVWACRCQCGMYESRGAVAINSPENAFDACQDCRYLRKVKSGRGNSPFARGDHIAQGGE